MDPVIVLKLEYVKSIRRPTSWISVENNNRISYFESKRNGIRFYACSMYIEMKSYFAIQFMIQILDWRLFDTAVSILISTHSGNIILSFATHNISFSTLFYPLQIPLLTFTILFHLLHTTRHRLQTSYTYWNYTPRYTDSSQIHMPLDFSSDTSLCNAVSDNLCTYTDLSQTTYNSVYHLI